MRWLPMQKFVPLILAVAGFIVMVVATCDYVFNVNDFDTYIFILGLVALIAGYILTMKAVRDMPEPEPEPKVTPRRSKRKGE